MSCGHCVGHIEEALKGVCGIKSVKVDFASKFITVELAHHVDDAKIKAEIDEAGYQGGPGRQKDCQVMELIDKYAR